MNVRSAAQADLPAILEIYNHAVLNSTATADYEPATLEARTAWFQDRQARGLPILVAEDESEQILGWGALSPYHTRIGYRFTVENSIYVAVDQRGKGVGKALLSALIDAARKYGLHSIIAVIDGDNAVSMALHTQFGFVKVGHQRETVYKFDRWLDVVYMQLFLEDPGAKPTNKSG